MQYNIIDYHHHAMCYIPITYLHHNLFILKLSFYNVFFFPKEIENNF